MSPSASPEVDLLIAGAGGGLVAALRAAQHGLNVLVVEASEHFRRGNNTSMSTAMIPGVDTRYQREAGIVDSVGQFVEDVRHKTRGQGNLALARALGRVSGPMVEWLADQQGLPLELMTDMHYPGHSVDRCHTLPGRHGSTLMDHLVRRVSETDQIDLMAPVRLVDIEVDKGQVTAGVVDYPDGNREIIATRSLLLATNGFAADRALVTEHMPEIAAATYHGSEWSRGDALRIGRAHGAAIGFLDAYQGHGALSRAASSLVGWATIMHGGVLLNLNGQRFGDETSGYSEFGPYLAAQPGATGWLIFDRRIHDLCMAFGDFRQTVSAGAVHWADNVDELIRVTGLPQAAVQELADSDAAARGVVGDRFGRTFEAPLAAPYAAVQVVPALFHTQGGLMVNDSAQVVTAEGSPIVGLYASGGAAAGISGHGASGYLAGNGLLPALGLAYLAADHCADRRGDND